MVFLARSSLLFLSGKLNLLSNKFPLLLLLQVLLLAAILLSAQQDRIPEGPSRSVADSRPEAHHAAQTTNLLLPTTACLFPARSVA